MHATNTMIVSSYALIVILHRVSATVLMVSQLKGKSTNAAVDIESVDESRPFIEMVRMISFFFFER